MSMHRWQIVNTWNGGEGGRVVCFISKNVGDEGHNECFKWIHHNTSFSFSEATKRQGYKVEKFAVVEQPSTEALQADDECPNCQNGTLELQEDALVCRGECGAFFRSWR